jgi:hypothetical protein
MLETTSAVRGTSNTAAWASLTTTYAYIFILVFLAAAAMGGCSLVCIGFSGSAHPQELANYALYCNPSCSLPLNHSGWSRPLLPDHAELAALEQKQLEAARARRGWWSAESCRPASTSARTDDSRAPPSSRRHTMDALLYRFRPNLQHRTVSPLWD